MKDGYETDLCAQMFRVGTYGAQRFTRTQRFLCNAEISLRGPVAMQTATSKIAGGIAQRKRLNEAALRGGGAANLWALIQLVD
jgi:hypothetical protein